jgi:hypothetical protein
MEIFGGFMVMMSIIGLFLSVVWLIMPFVVFAIKGKQDRSLELLEAMEKRLAAIDGQLTRLQPGNSSPVTPATSPANADLPESDHGIQAPAEPLA